LVSLVAFDGVLDLTPTLEVDGIEGCRDLCVWPTSNGDAGAVLIGEGPIKQVREDEGLPSLQGIHCPLPVWRQAREGGKRPTVFAGIQAGFHQDPVAIGER
jgi:hypothetical protein